MLTGLYAKAIMAAVIAAMVAGAFWYVSNLKSTIKDLEQQLIVCVAQGNVLSQKILDQNAAADAFKADADKRLAAASIDLAAAREAAKKAKGKATVIYKTAPSTPGATCEADRKSALDLINGGAK